MLLLIFNTLQLGHALENRAFYLLTSVFPMSVTVPSMYIEHLYKSLITSLGQVSILSLSTQSKDDFLFLLIYYSLHSVEPDSDHCFSEHVKISVPLPPPRQPEVLTSPAQLAS